MTSTENMGECRAAWVVLDAVEQVMRCERCQTTKPLAVCVGKPIGEAAAIMNGFVDEHRGCK